MFGTLSIDGTHFCLTLEDELREVKVPGKTAIPAGLYDIGLRNSPKFGPGTIEIKGVPNFTDILIHAGNSADDTAGCIIVGDRIDRLAGTISGGAVRGILQQLKGRVAEAIIMGEPVTIAVLNASGACYVDSGKPVGVMRA